MDIQFRTTKLKKELTASKAMIKAYGSDQSKMLKKRIKALGAAITLFDFEPGTPPERCHELAGDRKGQLSVDIKHPYRLLFEPADNPRPTLADAGLDWKKVSKVRILGVEDTHGN